MNNKNRELSYNEAKALLESEIQNKNVEFADEDNFLQQKTNGDLNNNMTTNINLNQQKKNRKMNNRNKMNI